MKRLTIAALVAGQVVAAQPAAAQPALAADLVTTGEQQGEQVGAFVGFRLRIALSGDMRRNEVRAGFTVAPTLSSDYGLGGTGMWIGEGLEFGYRSDGPFSLSVAGQDMRQLWAAQDDDGDDGGVPTWALVAGGIVAVGVGGYLIVRDAVECDPEEGRDARECCCE